jgi:hypothetical protein
LITLCDAVGNIYLHGSRTANQNITKALQYFKMAYDWGGVAASGLLGYTLIQLEMAHYKTWGMYEEILLAYAGLTRRILSYAMNRGDANALIGTAVGHMYGLGGFEKDMNKSYYLLLKNPEVHPDAGFYLGEILSGHYFISNYAGNDTCT